MQSARPPILKFLFVGAQKNYCWNLQEGWADLQERVHSAVKVLLSCIDIILAFHSQLPCCYANFRRSFRRLTRDKILACRTCLLAA